jgi:hypothetical protein
MTEIEQAEQGPIQRAEAESRQPRFSEGTRKYVAAVRSMLETWTKDTIQQIPPYQPNSRELDKWLSDFWRTETLLSGVVSSVINIDKNRGWNLTGGRNQVARFTRVLRGVEGGQGWRRYASLQSESFWTTNIGAVSEIGRIGDQGPLGALYHVDPTRCRLTGDLQAPLEYTPSQGKPQAWGPLDYIRSTSLPMVQEDYHQLGYCAVMRAVQFAVLMVAIYRHDKEMLFALMPKGLLLMSGIDEQDWEDAMVANAERLTAKEREFFAGLSIFFSGVAGDIDAKLVTLSQLPHGFNMSEWTNMLMYGYALVFGYDPREFWPVSGGTLGTGRETEVQAMKATGKGGLDFALSFQDNLQRELPPTLLFEFEQRDAFGEASEYEAIRAFAEAVNEMAAPAGPGMGETLTPEQRRILYAEKGFIPDEWTLTEEDVTATDVESVERDRLLSQDQVLRACERFPAEPIVRLTWRYGRGIQVKRLWDSGQQALEPARFYSVPGRQRQAEVDPEQVYFDDGTVVITGEDVQRALSKWDNRHDEAWAGLPDAAPAEAEEENA